MIVRVSIDEQRLDITQSWTVKAHTVGQKTLTFDGVNLRDLVADLPDGGHFDYSGQRLALTWSRAFERGEKRVVHVCYSVQFPVGGVIFSNPTASPGQVARFAVTDHETERARHWLLCVDHPSVRPSLNIQLRAETGLVLLANGSIVKHEDHGDGTSSVHFAQRQGCPSYLTCFAVGNFTRWDAPAHHNSRGSIPIAGFALPPFELSHIERTFRHTAEMLTFLEDRLGVAYPFDKYYQFAAPGIGGAMENISLVSWDERFLLDEQLETEERQLINIVNVHEMAHSWFGDSVVCRDHSHSWLKEGWATYIESCWLEATQGPVALAYDLWLCRQAYFTESDERYQRPIVTRHYDSSFDLFDRHLYHGAGLRIHMLRQQLGETTFWQAVSSYLREFAGKTAETDDFRRVMEEHSGRSLAQFFDQWFYTAGFPDLKVTFEFDAEAQRGRFEVLQLQADEKTARGLMNFELEVAFGNITLGEPHSISVTERRTVASFAMKEDPKRIRVDPRGRLLHRRNFDPGVSRLERELRAEDAGGRIEAAEQLSTQGHAGVRAIANAYPREEHWEVRACYLHALGQSNSLAAREALMNVGNSETDPQCGALLYRAIGKYRHQTLIPYLLGHLNRDLGYRAREAALEALGAQREQAPLQSLAQASKRVEFGGFSQAGALRALGETRHPEALQALSSALRSDDLTAAVKPAAAAGLGSLASILDKRPREKAVEALLNALHDENPLVCLAAAEALGVASASEAAPALKSLAERLPHQEATRVRRVMRKLLETDSASKQQGMMEKLEERILQLEAKVMDLQAADKASS